MNRIYTLVIVVVFLGFICSPVTAVAFSSEAELFYGISLDTESEKSTSDVQPKTSPAEVDVDKKKSKVALPDAIMKPECFFGYTDQGCE